MIEASFRPGDRARAIGAWSGLGGVAAALGPLLGGYLVDAVSWRAIFLINLPLGLFVMAMAPRHVPETRDPMAHGRLDITGAALVGLGLGGTTYALIEAPNKGADPLILVAGHRRRRSPRRFPAGGAAQLEPDDAARHLQVAAVQRRQPGHVRRLRGAGRRLLPARLVPADLARLLGHRGRRRLAADHGVDAVVLGAVGRPCAAHRSQDPADRRAARDRGRAAC